MYLLSALAFLAGSSLPPSALSECAIGPAVAATWTSSPEVNARSPAPVRMMARTEGLVERCVNMSRRPSHILGDGSVGQ